MVLQRWHASSRIFCEKKYQTTSGYLLLIILLQSYGRKSFVSAYLLVKKPQASITYSSSLRRHSPYIRKGFRFVGLQVYSAIITKDQTIAIATIKLNGQDSHVWMATNLTVRYMARQQESKQGINKRAQVGTVGSLYYNIQSTTPYPLYCGNWITFSEKIHKDGVWF